MSRSHTAAPASPRAPQSRDPRGRILSGGGDGSEAPDRLTVLTCIGCGALSELGECLSGCAETRLDLVPADTFDELTTGLARTREATDAFRAIGQQLATVRPGRGEIEAAYRAIQTQARAALRRHPDRNDDEPDWIRPADPTTSWWCPRCGGLDAPQPCIGVCIRRPAEWVRYELYEQDRNVALRELERERRLRRLVRRVAYVTPRGDQWERGWEVAQAEAREAIGAPQSGARVLAPD